MKAINMHTDHEKPKIHHTKRGGLYAKPRDILTSGSAQRQLDIIRKSDLLKKVQKKSR